MYEAADGSPQRETDPLGDNHRVMMPTYSISKIAAEAVVRTTCREFEIPTTIARLNVPYGDDGGWPAFHLALVLADQPVPVHPNGPSRYNPIHEDDIIATLPGDARRRVVFPRRSSTGVATTRRASRSGRRSWPSSSARKCASIVTERTIGGIPTDNTKRLALVGPTHVAWKDGMRRMYEAMHSPS